MEIEPMLEIDEYESQVGMMLDAFKDKLIEDLRMKGSIIFQEYVKGKPTLEKVRSFILLLFTAMEGLIRLEQEDVDVIIKKKDMALV